MIVRKRVLLALALLALCAALPNFASAEGPGQTPADSTSDPRFGAVEAFRAPSPATTAGVKWSRVIFWWYGVQPSGPEDWNEHYFPDGILQREIADGRTVVGCLMNPPVWASGSGSPADLPRNLYLPYDSPQNYWGQFVKRIVSRYKGRIDQWIIGNEPDVWDVSNPAHTWNGTVQDYFQFLKIAYLAAKDANPNAKIITAGFTYWWDKEFGRDLYFKRLLEVAAKDDQRQANNWYFDALALQLYNDPKSLYDVPQLHRQIMRDYGVPTKPVWITETNVAPWDDPIDPLSRERFRATLDEQASYLIQAFAYGLAADVERLQIYKMTDSPDLPTGVERYGLVRADGTARPSFTAFQVASKYLAGTRNGTIEQQGAIVRVKLDKGDQTATVIWNRSAQPTTALVPGTAQRALIVDQRGATKQIESRNGSFILALPPATANTIPGAPNEFRIGGEPLIVVQSKPPEAKMQGLDMADVESWTDRATGFTVSGAWLASFRAMGGLDYLGSPKSQVMSDPANGGQTVQYFQRGVLEYHPENPLGEQIQRRLLGDLLFPGADAPLTEEGRPEGDYHFFPFSPHKVTGLGHFVADSTSSGQPTFFKQFFDRHGGISAFGYPKEEPKLRDGLWTQRFQAAVLEYHPENDREGTLPDSDIPFRNYLVQAALIGDAYMEQVGVLPR